MLEILISAHGGTRLAAAHAFVDAVAEPDGETLLVGASRDAVDDFVRERTRRAEATFGFHRLTLGTLASRIAAAELAASRRTALSSLGAVALAARAVFRTLGEGRLRYFAPVARAPSFARAVHATLEELRRMRVSAADLERPEGSGAAADMAELLRVYEEELAAAGIADRAELYTTAARIARASPLASIAGRPILFLDVPVRTAVELDFVRALLEHAPRALCTVPKGDDKSEAALLALPHERVAASAPELSTSGVTWLQDRLFEPMGGEVPPGDGRVEFFSAPGEGREAVEIVRRVLRHAESGVAFDQMAIFVRSPAGYTPALETALRRAGIPAAFADGVRRPHPSGRALLALVACAAERCSAARFAEYLSLGQVPAEEAVAARVPFIPSTDEGMPRIPERPDGPPERSPARAVRRWEELLVRASIVEGADRWGRRLAGLRFELEQERDQVARRDPASARVAMIGRDIEDLAELRAFALPVIESLAAWPQRGSWGEWLGHLETLAMHALAAPDVVLQVLAELHPMESVGPVGIDEVLDVLSPRLSTASIPPPKHRYGRVYVATLDQARGRTFRVVFVPGLAERVFPQKLSEDPLLLDDVRTSVHGGLVVQADRAVLERLRFRLGVGAATEHLVVSYPRVEVGTSRGRVPSLYALEVVRATTGILTDVGELQRDAAHRGEASLAWPAPPVADDAIDETEHDLATLHGLLADPVEGRARYLLEQNPHLARSLRARWSRWHSEGFTRDDGLIFGGPWIREALAGERLRERARSVSSLQHYAACPYRFYLSAILHLAPREGLRDEEGLAPLSRGSLFHRVQAEAMRELADRGSLPVTEANVEASARVLDAVLARVAAEYCDRLRPAVEQVFWDEIAEMKVDLYAWMLHVARTADAWEPLAFDVGFGLRAAPYPEAHVSGGFRIHGAIDAVERSRQTRALRVTDFKTGQARTAPRFVVAGGELLQPVVYSLALEALLADPGPAGSDLRAALGVTGTAEVDEARLFYCTTRGGFAEHTLVLDPIARSHGVQVLAAIDRAIEAGFFPAYPRAEACERCAFRVVCGPHEEERIRKKRVRTLPDPERIRELLELRSLE